MRIIANLLFTISILFTGSALAEVTHTPVNFEGQLVITKHPKYFRVYCPDPSSLVKNRHTLIWSAPGGWKSHAQSFATKITGFTVAQWQGINIGYATCVYTGTPKGTFPILLLSSTIPITPKGGKWKYDAQKHYSNCVSNSIFDCPLIVEATQPKADVYDIASDIKTDDKQPPSPSMQGF
ncbi:MAG: T4SS-associated protein EirA [Coxiellaceae bacterium]|nr:T4SS-associated protein EirA [Coxiellaceae bacterium]